MIVEPLIGKAVAATGHKASIIAFEGSVRSGKTWSSLIEWLEYCRRGPAGYLIMVGKTQRTVTTNCILPLQQMLGPKRVKLNTGTGRVTICGREVMIVGANDERAVTKVQGPTFAGAYVDECSTVPEPFFDMLYSRLSVEGAQLWLTSNPEAPAHWLKLKWLDRARLWIDRDGSEHVNDSKDALDLVRVSFKLEDNAHNLPPAYISRIKAAYTGLWYRRYVMGEWCIAAGSDYDMWDPGLHDIAAAHLPGVERLVCLGIDYGTTHKTRGYLLGISSEAKPRLVVVDEWAPQRMTNAGHSADLRKWLAGRQPRWVAVDPSAAAFSLQLFTDGMKSVMNADNAVVNGIRLVSSLLAAGSLVISSACTDLTAEIPGYSWDPKATLRGEDAPLKVNDDCCDAFRYAITSSQQIWGRIVPLTIAIETEEMAA